MALIAGQTVFAGASLTWQDVYARFNAWRKDGSWQGVWFRLLRENGAHLNCSSVQLDGSRPPAKNGGEAVGYQSRKKARTTTALFLTDNRGQPLACASPQAGNYHDTHRLNALFGEICASLEAANIPIAGLFLNADKAFDTKDFRQECARRDIEANIPRNRRTADWQTDDDTPLRPRTLRSPRRGRARQRLARRLQNLARALRNQRRQLVGLALARLCRHLFAKNQPKADFLNSFNVIMSLSKHLYRNTKIN